MGTEVLLILGLILVNGILACSELAVVSSRKTRLERKAREGDLGAQRALELAEHPTRFLSTVQIGITLVGILAGVYGGATLADYLADRFAQVPLFAPYSRVAGLAVVVISITYLSLVVGELVPKRIALTHPERIAARVARPLQVLSVLATPVVKILSLSTDALLAVLRVRKSDDPAITEDEISAMIELGTRSGVITEGEQDLVERIFWLGDKHVDALMTPRRKMIWLDVHDEPELNLEKMREHRHSRFLVCEGGVDQVLGLVDVRDLLARALAGEPMDLQASLRKPLVVPDSMRALRLLELFRESGVHFALVVDEYGGVEGLVTLNDILEEITGDLVLQAVPRIQQREDGSWLVDASLPIEEFWDGLGLEDPEAGDRTDYNTLGGFVLARLGHIPGEGESFETHGLRFEIIDMDGHRVDKLLVMPSREQPAD